MATTVRSGREAHCSANPARASSTPAAPRPAAAAAAPSSPAVSSQGEGPTPAQIAQALTWARTRPGEVVAALRGRLEHYKGKEYFPPDRQGRCIVTKEGTQAVNDALAYVQALAPMGGVGSSSEQGLALAAEDHVADIGRTGTAAHNSSDGTSAAERVQRYGSFTSFGECLWYGSALADARTIILDLIVDDGVPSRGHRKGIYNPVYDTVGAAYGAHVTFGRMAAMEFASGWQPSDMFIRARLQSGPPRMGQQAVAKAKAKAQTQWSLGTCALCNEPIKGGKVVEVAQLGGKLHFECFQCSACSTQLAGGAFKVQAKKPYCTTCWAQRFAERCTACGEPITGTMAKCALGVFHAECVVCATCNKVIGKAAFSTDGGVFTCGDCSGGGDRRRALGRPGSASNSSSTTRGRPGSAPHARPDSASNARTGPLAAAGGNIAGSNPKAGATGSPAVAKASATGSPAVAKAKSHAARSPRAAPAGARARSPASVPSSSDHRAKSPAAVPGSSDHRAKSPAAVLSGSDARAKSPAAVRAKPAPKPKVSFGKAKSTLDGLGLDYTAFG